MAIEATEPSTALIQNDIVLFGLIAATLGLVFWLASGPTRALGLMRQGLARALEQSYTEAMATEAAHQMIAADSDDALEGGAAFLQRRKPQFKGR